MEVQIFNSSSYDSNTYVVNRNTLIDPGMNLQYILDKLEHKNLLKDIELIILTHAHYDHTGAAKSLAEITNSNIGIHSDDVQLLTDNISSAAHLFGQKAPDIIPDIFYKDGDFVQINDTNLKVIHTPGHTPGSICLYEPATKSLFSGDTIFPNGSFGRTDFLGGSSENLSKSIEKITKFDIKTLYPGHGSITDIDVNHQVMLSFKASKTI
ncbi:MBL fold metallo-hydrolase [Methanosalsum natronophilum]|uniref:MBL fold metallo-hydrolase n=1 Tax=Methanosalsum natronophilum TaxID=768733 RepID=A0A3R8CC62_9EURY|nr:MBL fold metallo-hydrolase [Methanosalsum natronophilum]MCS3923918.1 glyoxylase-like metal-dependent hydrolase (beta-lactamase superfamily II) [Methanosalsum natronophilum]RQD84887.1 MAG: MBL fold metallo-hydrolase [Methanosalsum natronophilum]